MYEFWLCFIPLFVAVDAVGVLPIFLALTEGLDAGRLRNIIIQSVITASAAAIVFLAFGPALLMFLSITVSDFMIAGGILLLAISLVDLVTGEKRQSAADPASLGAETIGVPMITGPAVLATCILLASTHGKAITAVAALANIVLAGVVFGFAGPITRGLGRNGTRTLSKIASLLLAAIAVMLIRRGILGAVAGARL